MISSQEPKAMGGQRGGGRKKKRETTNTLGIRRVKKPLVILADHQGRKKNHQGNTSKGKRSKNLKELQERGHVTSSDSAWNMGSRNGKEVHQEEIHWSKGKSQGVR